MDEQYWQEMSGDTSAENSPTPTATHSIVSESMALREKSSQKDHDNPHLELQPGDKGPYLVRTRQEPRLFLSLCYGELQFLPIPTAGSYWKCTRKDGWFGLRNTVSGRYISHDDKGQIYVKVLHLTPHEYFTDCRDPNGGYILKQLKSPTNELMEVSISKDKKSLVHQKEGGTAWDFIDTKYIRHSTWLQCPGMEPEELRPLPG
ncbi:hypothetical protein ACQKWADRAFT_285993 [Trichoderma austrokoningii]